MIEPNKIGAKRPQGTHGCLWAALGIALCLGLVATAVLRPCARLVWNVSSSAPIGLYSVVSSGYPQIGDMVVAKVPEGWRAVAARRRYIPLDVPLVKRVAAGPDDTVCAMGKDVFVNARRVAERRRRDAAGRPLSWWNGCKVLRNGTLFLLTPDPASFDGRYFGPTERKDVIGTAKLIWRR